MRFPEVTINTSVFSQALKVCEEMQETIDAWNNNENAFRVAEEAADTIQACETLQRKAEAIIGFCEELISSLGVESQEIYGYVYRKNRARGYYKE